MTTTTVDLFEISLGKGGMASTLAKSLQRAAREHLATKTDCDCELHRADRENEEEPPPLTGARAIVAVQELYNVAFDERKMYAEKAVKVVRDFYDMPCNGLVEDAMFAYCVDRFNNTNRFARALYEILPRDERPPGGDELHSPPMMPADELRKSLDTLRSERRHRIAANKEKQAKEAATSGTEAPGAA